ncbi:DUF4429 domain-containing protein [Methanosarcina acetivorans]|nr:DUF4429 domain-containing protein [Methanosarcina acetivorans]
MTEILMELKGVNGQLELYGDKIIIKRKGIRSKLTQGFFKGDKTIYIKQIAGIELKEGGLINGYIQFTLSGGVESRRGLLGKDGAVNDENTVMFAKKDNELAKRMKLEIENRMTSFSQPITVAVQTDGADTIRKYKQLCDDGIITQEEFELKKKEILGIKLEAPREKTAVGTTGTTQTKKENGWMTEEQRRDFEARFNISKN